jgi:hypothetical protein
MNYGGATLRGTGSDSEVADRALQLLASGNRKE